MRPLPLLALGLLLGCATDEPPEPCRCPRGETCDPQGDCVPADAAVSARRDLGQQRRDLGPVDRGAPMDQMRGVDRGPVEPLDQALPLDQASVEDLALDLAPPVDLAPVDRGPPEDRAPPVDQAAPPDQAIPDAAPRLAYGAACAAAADCASELCLGDPATGQGRCTAPCVDSAACPDQDLCVQAGGQGLCAPNDTGRPCARGADCLDGLCAAPQPALVAWLAPAPICVARCVDDRKCPTGFRCQVNDFGGGNLARICTPDVEIAALCPRGFREECPPCRVPGRDPLDTTLCLSLDGGGYCACTCDSVADCPRGWACHRDLVDTGDRARPGACVPLAGLRCTDQIQGGALQCPGLDCAVEPGADLALAFCTATCADDLDCPGAYRCQLIAGQRRCGPG